MDVIPKHTFLQVNPNTLEEVRRDINLHRPGEMKEAVRILQEWIQQQPHFKKKDFPKEFPTIVRYAELMGQPNCEDVLVHEPRLYFSLVRPEWTSIALRSFAPSLLLPLLRNVTTSVIYSKDIQQRGTFASNYLEQILVASKGSIDRAKHVVDSICTVRTLIPEVFAPYNAQSGSLDIWDKNLVALLPKMSPDNDRIFICKIIGKYDKAKNVDLLYNYAFLILDFLRLHDYFNKVVVIYDLVEMDFMDALTNVDLLELKKIFQIFLDSFSLRPRRIHILTHSKLINRLLTFFKPLFKKKIMDRVEVNKSADELYQHYPRGILPKDLGGDEKSLLDLHDECLGLISSDEYLKHARSMLEARVDEALRPQSQLNELYAGTVGTFRTLNLD